MRVCWSLLLARIELACTHADIHINLSTLHLRLPCSGDAAAVPDSRKFIRPRVAAILVLILGYWHRVEFQGLFFKPCSKALGVALLKLAHN